MNKWIFPCLVACSSLVLGDEVEKTTEVVVAEEKFDVNGVIAAAIAILPAPAAWVEAGEPDLLVFSESEEARQHVRKGFALIHASWDFEAYRHFSEALKEDPQCLMAYCGVVLSLTNPQHEFKEQRAMAFNRMLSLAEFKEGEEFYYPENERLYAVGIAELLLNGVRNGSLLDSPVHCNHHATRTRRVTALAHHLDTSQPTV